MTLEPSFQGGGKEGRMNSPGRKSSAGRGVAHLENYVLIGIPRRKGVLNEYKLDHLPLKFSLHVPARPYIPKQESFSGLG